jgi:hypothetical protein
VSPYLCPACRSNGAHLQLPLDKTEGSSVYSIQSEVASLCNGRDAELSIKLAGSLTK